ncbi:MAG: alpha/beta hydrolase [Actinomycetaceae bacterium]|nr:alpha/beta hydrolase [Actinomycetaceae bacterium]
MSEVRIFTPRGKQLSADYVVPVDSRGRCIVFVHSFLGDRHSAGWFDEIGAVYRGLGYQTLAVDLAGCGSSDDDVISLDHHIEDVRSVVSWVFDEGAARVGIHAHGFGATVSLRANLDRISAMVLSGPVCGPTGVDWTKVFSEAQLDQLEETGFAQIPGSPGEREAYVFSKQTLADLTLTDPHVLTEKVAVPVLLVHDRSDLESGLVELSQQAFHLFPGGTHLEVLREAHFGAGPQAPDSGAAEFTRLTADWFKYRMPPRPVD